MTAPGFLQPRNELLRLSLFKNSRIESMY